MLKYKRYEEIKKIVSEVFEDYNINKIPIDVFLLAEKMGAKIELNSKNREFHARKGYYFVKPSPDVVMLDITDTKNAFRIFIDDIYNSQYRQKFTLAHELAHIFLEHTEQNDENEEEANFAASYMLCPASLAMINCGDYLFDPVWVQKIFEVSKSAAEVMAEHNKNRINFGNLKVTKYEKVINTLLEDALKERIEAFLK